MFLPCGEYLIECWGASGGDRDGLGGRGAYVSGVLPLYEDTTVYVYVGEQGSIDNVRKTFNGGGSQNLPRASIQYAGSGGGASDVRLINGSWDNESSIQSRIIVATGGGGASFYSTAEAPEGYGGALEGGNASFSQYTASGAEAYINATGGTQFGGGTGGGVMLGEEVGTTAVAAAVCHIIDLVLVLVAPHMFPDTKDAHHIH